MSTDNAPASAGAETTVDLGPSNTRALGIEVDSYQPEGLSSVELDLPGKEPVGGADVSAVDDKDDENVAADDAVDETADEKDGDETAVEYGDKLDIGAYQNEFDTNGKLSDATYDHITNLTGLERGDIDAVVVAMKAQQDANTARWDSMMGGAENKDAVLEWARSNYTDAQRAAFNKVLDSKDVAAIDLAVKGLVADYREAGGSFKATVGAVDPNAEPNFNREGSTGGFASEGEYREAVRSPKYKRDPAFRAEVRAKLQASAFYKKSRA